VPPTLALALATIRTGARRPAPYVLAGLGCLALWGGVSLEILALGEGNRAPELAVGTAEGVALVLAALLVPSLVDEDARSGWGQALWASRGGLPAILTGRYLGGWALSLAAGVPVLLLAAVLGGEGPRPLAPTWPAALLVASALACAWALLLARLLPPAAAALGTLLVVALARVGAPAPSHALLPWPVDPRRAAPVAALAAQAASAAGLLFASFAVRPASES
jgi:hypothetical protein